MHTLLCILLVCVLLGLSHALSVKLTRPMTRFRTKTLCAVSAVKEGTTTTWKADNEPKVPNESESGLDKLKGMFNSNEDKKNKRPPIYQPGPYQYQLLSAAAYLVPIADAFDLGKYMFQAYPEIGDLYNTVFGPVAGIYNGVPFLPFAVFFLMSYVSRAPTFPVEVRFHFSQAFMLSIIQFVPSIAFGLLEKLGLPGMGVAYNTVFLWVMVSAMVMQALLLNPFSATKNPFLLNVVGFAMRYMNYSPSMTPK